MNAFFPLYCYFKSNFWISKKITLKVSFRILFKEFKKTGVFDIRINKSFDDDDSGVGNAEFSIDVHTFLVKGPKNFTKIKCPNNQ